MTDRPLELLHAIAGPDAYVLTVADTTRVASFLRTQGIDAHAYSGETESERRLELEDAVIGNDVKALVATSALGMGFESRTSAS